MRRTWEHVTRSPRQTWTVGRALGELLKAGDFVALAGPLGAGKTQLIQGIGAGLGVPHEEPVTSPTFVLVREYRGRLKLYHIDAYRLAGPNELTGLGLEEMLEAPESAIALEWADRVRDAVPADACWIELAHVGKTERRLRLCWATGRVEELIARVGEGRSARGWSPRRRPAR